MSTDEMTAMVLRRTMTIELDSEPLELVKIAKPSPASKEILIEVSMCGVCHTELDEIEGRTPPPKFPIIPGHEVVGRVAELGPGVTKHQLGDRVGVGWIHHSTGDADENLSPEFCATGRDVHGGYARFLTVPEDYAYPIPDQFSDAEAAPLLCAGGVGYRALRLTGLRDGQSLGLMGFGGSAHIVIQVVRNEFPSSQVFVFARDPDSRKLAEQLGAVWTGNTQDRPPQLLDAIIDTTPAWTPVVAALPCLRPGGRLVINAIRKENADQSALLNLSYHEHLWMEREIKTVANVTHFDLQEFLQIAGRLPIQPRVDVYPLAEANRALRDLKFKPVQGAKVLQIRED